MAGQQNSTSHPPAKMLLHQRASSAALIFFLKFFFAMWFFRYLLDPLPQLSELPLGYTDPVGWFRWMPVTIYTALHSYWALLLLKFGILAACVGVWYPKTRLVSAVIGTLLVANASAITRGFGHLNHAEIAPLLVTGILTLFACRLPSKLVRQPDHQPNSTAATGLILATLALSLAYALAGIERIAVGGLELFTGDTLPNYLVQRSFSTWVFSYNFSQWILGSAVLTTMLKIGTLAVTIAEIATPFCLVSRRTRLLILLFMPAFHVGVIFMFKIVFIELPLSLILLCNVTAWLRERSIAQESSVSEWNRAAAVA